MRLLPLKFAYLFEGPKNGRGRFSHRHLLLHLSAFLVMIIALVISLAVSFPGEVLRERIQHLIHQLSGQKVTIGGMGAALPPGLRITDLSWQPPAAGWPAVAFSSLRLSPLWSTLFSANPGVSFKASTPTGSLNGQIMKDGGLLASLERIHLSSYFPASLAYQPQGVLTGSVTTTGQLLSDEGKAQFELTIDEAAVFGLERLGVESGRVALGRLSLTGELQGTALKIDELRNEEGDVQVQGRLTILLNDSFGRSLISGQIDLTPAATLDPLIRDLLQVSGVRPDRQGNFRFRISGSLENPGFR